MKTFEFKSQICTSVEQSKRLLELGLKKWTADMYYPMEVEGGELPLIADSFFGPVMGSLPAWSLHRLLELLPKELKLDDKRLEFFITYDLDVMLVDERNEEYLTFFAEGLYDSLISYAEWLNTKNLLWEDKL